MPDDTPRNRPDAGPPDTTRQYRLTAIDRDDLRRAITLRLAMLEGGQLSTAALADLPPDARRVLAESGDPLERYRLRQWLDKLAG